MIKKTIQPFRATRYNAENISLADVISPPYDVIDENLYNTLTHRNKHNSIFVSYSTSVSSKKYSEIPQLFHHWKNESILIKDPTPSFYHLEERFAWNGKTKTRSGIFALVPVLKNAKILPHEKTFEPAVMDRLKLLEVTHKHIGPILMICQDKTKALQKALKTARPKSPTSVTQYLDDSIVYRMGIIDNPKHIQKIQTALSNKKLMIADGHHRFEAALKFAQATKQEQYILAFIASDSSDGLAMSPLHRVVHHSASSDQIIQKLEKKYKVKSLPLSFQRFEKEKCVAAYLDTRNRKMYCIYPTAETKKFKTSSEILHRSIFPKILDVKEFKYEDIHYYKNPMDVVSNSDAKLEHGFWLQNITIKQMIETCNSGKLLPQKSTFFYPKVMTGFVFSEF